MFRGFLNEIKNVAVNRATNRINTMMNNALGGMPGLPINRGRVSRAKNSFGGVVVDRIGAKIKNSDCSLIQII